MRFAGAVIGIVFGFVLCWSGMSDPDVIRSGLLFESAYLFQMFAVAVLVASIGVHVMRRRRPEVGWERDRVQRRHVVGSLMFGLGWGIADACPGPIAAQIGQGVPWALFTLVGALGGVYLFLRRGAAETEPACEPAPA